MCPLLTSLSQGRLSSLAPSVREGCGEGFSVPLLTSLSRLCRNMFFIEYLPIYFCFRCLLPIAGEGQVEGDGCGEHESW